MGDFIRDKPELWNEDIGEWLLLQAYSQ
jgi:hypothetical protein